MLIHFSVANFRSFKEVQTLSMEVDSRIKTMPENSFTLSAHKYSKPLLKSAALYGANESGKSNFIQALDVMRQIVMGSGRLLEGETIKGIEPFRLHSQTATEPSVFEVTFIQENAKGIPTQYQYGFAATNKAVLEEWLYVYHSPKPSTLFTRSNYQPRAEKEHRYEWLPAKLPAKSLIRKVGDNQLFITKAAEDQNSLLSPVIEWFSKLVTLLFKERFHVAMTAQACDSSETEKRRVIAFLKNIGSDIDDVQVETLAAPDEEDPSIKKRRLHFIHTTTDTNEPIAFTSSNESDGTFKLFEMIAPWLDMLNNGGVFVIDELNNSLHAELVRHLIEQIHYHNINNAQLIFSTHDISQMDETLFRPDQLWLIEKSRVSKSSELYPLSAIEGKPKKEALAASYMMGRFGGLPIIGDIY